MRFRVVVYGETAFHSGTYGDMHAKILEHHRRRQKAAGFRVDFSVTRYDPGEELPYCSGYAIIDNHAEVTS